MKLPLMKKIILLIPILMVFSCTERKSFDLQGHRGARGIMPENTVPAFIYAVDQGVNTLEMDIAVTRDNQLVVSHEPYMSAEICLDTLGSEFSDSLQYQYNIYEMAYDQVKEFDCGLKANPRFPEQQKMPVSKPLLAEVIDMVERYIEEKEIAPVSYNIEIKSRPETDTVFHPAPQEFSDLVYSFIDKKIDWNRIVIQSFDFRVLQYFHQKYPEVTLALLIENELSPDENIDSLGFKPDIYSPYYPLLSRESVQNLQEQGIKVIPWTVNEKEDMKQVINWGVDGLITDYPNRYQEIEK